MDRDDKPLSALIEECLGLSRNDAWYALFRRLQPLFARVMYRIASNWGPVDADEIADMVQSLFMKLSDAGGQALQKIPHHEEQCALAYCKVMAANCARDYFKHKFAERRGGAVTVVSDSEGDVDAFSLPVGDTDRRILLSQIDAALPSDAKEKAVFWLYYGQGYTAKEIALIQAFGLTAKGVESMIHRLTLAVRKKLGLFAPFSEKEGK